MTVDAVPPSPDFRTVIKYDHRKWRSVIAPLARGLVLIPVIIGLGWAPSAVGQTTSGTPKTSVARKATEGAHRGPAERPRHASPAGTPGPDTKSHPEPSAEPPVDVGARPASGAGEVPPEPLPAKAPVVAQEPAPKDVLPDVPRASLPSTEGLRITALSGLVGIDPVVRLEAPEEEKPMARDLGELTLVAAMRGAVSYSLESRAASARVEAARQTERAALGQILPRIDAKYSIGQAQFKATGRPPPDWMERSDATVSIRQPLFNYGALRTWQQQKQLVAAAEERRVNTDSSTALEASSAFLAAYQAQLTIEFGREYATMLTDLERYVSARASSGATSPADADRVRARVANTQAILSEARATLFSSLGNLRRLLGGLPDRLSIGGMPPRIAPAALEPAAVEAIAANPELQAGRRDIAAASVERDAIRGRFMPSIDLEISRLEFRNASGTAGQQEDKRAMVIMTLPIFTGGGDLATYRALAAKQAEQEFLVGHAERRLRFELENAFSVLDSIAPRLDSTLVELSANRKVVSAYREQLFAANRSLLDVLDAYQRLYQSKNDLVALLVAEAQTKLRVAHVTGRLQTLVGGRVVLP
jgi:outer membrane protein TolC